MIFYIGPFTTTLSVEIKKLTTDVAEIPSLLALVSIGIELFKFIDMIIVGYLVEINLDNLFPILMVILIFNSILNLLRKKFCSPH